MNEMREGIRFFRGVVNGVLLSIPIWIALILLCGCGSGCSLRGPYYPPGTLSFDPGYGERVAYLVITHPIDDAQSKFFGRWGKGWEPGKCDVGAGDIEGLGMCILAQLKWQDENPQVVPDKTNMTRFVLHFGPVSRQDSRFSLVGGIVVAPGDPERVGHEAMHQIAGKWHDAGDGSNGSWGLPYAVDHRGNVIVPGGK